MQESDIIHAFKRLIEKYSYLELYKNLKINSVEDIQKIPIMTREELEKCDINTAPERPVRIFTTSGSTGKNLVISVSKEASNFVKKRIQKMILFSGMLPEVSILNLFDYSGESGMNTDRAFSLLGNPIINFGVPSEERLHLLVDLIKKTKPAIVLSAPSSLHSVFSKLNDKTLVKQIYSGGSFFSGKFRENIMEMSGAKIFMLYACTEVSAIAIEEKNKPEGKYRLFDEGLYIEVEDEKGKCSETGTGNLLITDFYNFSTPIIRYRIGDKVEITREGDKKYLECLGRADNYTNINEEIVPLNRLSALTMQIIGHDKFLYLIKPDETSGNDRVFLCVEKEDLPKIESATDFMQKNKIRIFIRKKEWKGKFPMTRSGKYINIVDARKKILADKKLNL